MPPDELESVLARHVPGEGQLEFHRLGNGLVNETYRVLRGGSAYVLRVAAANAYDLGLDRAWEARVLERAAAADLAPVPVYCDPQRGILIARWVDGRPWSPVEVRRSSNIARMAELMRRIHALPMPAPARLMSPATRTEYLRLQLLGWLYDYVCLLWSELYLNLHRNERPGVDTPGAAPGGPQGGVAARARLLAARLHASPSSRTG